MVSENWKNRTEIVSRSSSWNALRKQCRWSWISWTTRAEKMTLLPLKNWVLIDCLWTRHITIKTLPHFLRCGMWAVSVRRRQWNPVTCIWKSVIWTRLLVAEEQYLRRALQSVTAWWSCTRCRSIFSTGRWKRKICCTLMPGQVPLVKRLLPLNWHPREQDIGRRHDSPDFIIYRS